jgi:hypothetical protein
MIVFLMDTRSKEPLPEHLRCMFQFSGRLVVSQRNRGGGLVLFLKTRSKLIDL